MTIEVTSNNRPVVTVQHSKRISDLVESGVRLYLPVDSIGHIQEVSKACRLECWISKPEERRQRLASAFDYTAAGLARALLKAPEEDVYGTLPMAAACMSLSKMNDWFYTLHRHVDGDVINYTYQAI